MVFDLKNLIYLFGNNLGFKFASMWKFRLIVGFGVMVIGELVAVSVILLNSELSIITVLALIGIICIWLIAMVGLLLWLLKDSIEQKRFSMILRIGPILARFIPFMWPIHTDFMMEPIRTSIRTYIRTSDYQLIDTLIAAGVHRFDRDGAGRTPIHYACHYGKDEIVRKLIRNDPRCLNLLDNAGQTGLDIALICRNRNLVIDLIRLGAHSFDISAYRDSISSCQQVLEALGWVPCQLERERIRQIRFLIYFKSSLTARLLEWIQ